MHWDKRRLGIGILLLFFTLICVIGWITKGFVGYYLTGSILFTILGIGFIRSARNK